MQDFQDAYFAYIGDYCGHDEDLDGLIDWLENAKYKSNDGVDCLKIGLEERERFPHIGDILGCLILMFGNYGVSPTYGWLEDVKGAIDFLKYMRKNWEKPYTDYDEHDLKFEELHTPDSRDMLLSVRATCKRCGLKSDWLPNRGLAKGQINRYQCRAFKES